jgi:hypothetical protein
VILKAVALGAVIGAIYMLSPLLVITGMGFALLIRWARQVPDETERRILTAMLVTAIGLRLVVIAGLFASTDHQSVPFGTFFGDEDYFVKRSIWLRNLALDVPISLADVRYAYDDAIQTSFVWMLAALQVVVGPSPYGLHLVSVFLYVAGALSLYHAVRPGFGQPASLVGLGLLLFLPSLFAWSIAVLKEPVFFALMAGVVWATVAAARQPSWTVRLLVAGLLLPMALAAETIRDGGLVVAGAGTLGGVLLALAWSRRRLMLAVAVVAMVAVPFALSRGRVLDRLDLVLANAVQRHWDHVHAPGHSYMILEPSFYVSRPLPGDLTRAEAIRYAIGGLAAYVMVPAPWQVTSRAELAYLPEQLVWYLLVALAPFGVWAGVRRDPFVTAILLVHLLLAVALVAMTSGNVGTLVRHRALALPYVVWFSGLGLSVVLARLSGIRTAAAGTFHRQQRAEA